MGQKGNRCYRGPFKKEGTPMNNKRTFKESKLYELGIQLLAKITKLPCSEITAMTDEIFKYVSSIPNEVSVGAIDMFIKKVSEQYKTDDISNIFITLLIKEEVQIKFNLDPIDSIQDFIGWLYVYYVYSKAKGFETTPMENYLIKRLKED